jgi:hypothetical protein
MTVEASQKSELTPEQNDLLNQISTLAGVERQKILDFVGGEQELADFLNSEVWLDRQMRTVSNSLNVSEFQNWVVSELKSKKDLLAGTSLRPEVAIPTNEIPSAVFNLGRPISTILTKNEKNHPYVQIVWRHMKESTWGIAAGEAEFSFAGTNFVVREWKSGVYVWIEK